MSVIGTNIHLVDFERIFFTTTAVIIFLVAGYWGAKFVFYRIRQKLLEVFPERNPHPVLWLSPSCEVIYQNPSANRLMKQIGIETASAAELLPQDIGERMQGLQESKKTKQTFLYQLGERYLQGDIHVIGGNDGFHLHLLDITERKRAEEALIFRAYHDDLTDLPNRRSFGNHLEQALTTQDDKNGRTIIFVVGLKRFDLITGSLGHDAGDRLLVAVTTRLQQIIRECQDYARHLTLFHIGGHLFGILMRHAFNRSVPSRFANRIIAGMDEPLYVDTREMTLAVNIGISIFPVDGKNSATLLRNAETAMHQANKDSGSHFRFFSEEMNAKAEQWLILENYLRHALEHDELCLFYQPKTEAQNGYVKAVEALLRWQHPELGLLNPSQFIELAEDSGLIIPISEWALQAACRQIKIWRAQIDPDLSVAINISAYQFHQQNLPELIERILGETELLPGALELEITESVAMKDLTHTTRTLHELKKMGISLSLDDFGTGFSSLAYMKNFPVDKLKIDQAFIRHLTTDRFDAAIIRGIIEVAHRLDIQVIAEGVETEEQLTHLKQEGCDQVQGNFISPALSADEASEFLQRGRLTASAQSVTAPG